MAHLIHARLQSNGRLLYGIWSTVTDSYRFKGLNEEGLRAQLEQDAIMEHRRSVEPRIERAKEFGSSSQIDNERVLEEPWEEERKC